MNENPKSIWKKSWTGPHWLRAWLILVAATFVIALIIILFIPGGPSSLSDWAPALVALLGVSLVSATVFVGLWLFIRCFFNWRNFKRLLFGLSCFFTLAALFYAVENFRGKLAWNSFKREWEAKGEKFEPRDFIPAPVPDDQNFALTPFVASSYAAYFDKDGHELNPRKTNIVNRMQMPVGDDSDWKDWPTDGDWTIGTKTDLRAWQQYYRALSARTNRFPVPPQPGSPASDVLLALSKYDSTLAELREAAKLPYSRFPLVYGSDDPAMILLPHLASFKSCSRFLQLRASAELQNGQGDQALADVRLCLRLVESVRTEPLLISHLVRIAVTPIAIQPIYEGIVEHRWSDAQLAELNSDLAKLDYLRDYKFSVGGDMAFIGVSELEYLERTRKISPFLSAMNGTGANGLRGTPGVDVLCWALPSGWFRQNQVSFCRFWMERGLHLADLEHRSVSPRLADKAYADLDAQIAHPTPYNLWQAVFLPFEKQFFGLVIVRKFAYAQTCVDLTRTACALERFRLTHGNYPETLDALAPRFITEIPHDVIGGQPLHYRRTDDGKFLLYSIGWNEKDDGGAAALHKDGKEDWENGDWVWHWPAR